MNRNAAIHTIGCRLNQADSALICGRLREAGWELVKPDDNSFIDLLIINSCSVTAAAAQKSRQAARRFKRLHPAAKVVVTGCSAEIDRDSLLNESSIDLVIGNPGKKKLIELIESLFADVEPVVSKKISSMDEISGSIFQESTTAQFPFKSRAFLKIQEGCENFCSYCIVPYARGPERSRDRDEIIADFKQLLASGFPEIVLTGVNICAYHDRGWGLPELIEKLCTFAGEYRIRLSSTEPHPDNLELIEVMSKNPKICRFLHLALQHGSDTILKSMNRKYTAADYRRFVQTARQNIPGIHIGTDLIVGFPGETDALFAESCQLVEAMEFANMHIFSFSPRRGTPAATMPEQVSAAEIKARYHILEKIAAESSLKFRNSQLKHCLPVIFEKKRNGICSGWSDNYINITTNAANIKLHQIVNIIPNQISSDGLFFNANGIITKFSES
ncbi:MAG: tRNA (N(6)-L-threonylcarbamoyladenosine(37)-C(2))-methylthiotransferase MtaB [Victivallaceae bacterium]|nr:tRNA (N(6)-L-threonylcarbamoyladenosine(37)-C(2))-methylthiotransferase MtaB [Victivallaceae bacterium]